MSLRDYAGHRSDCLMGRYCCEKCFAEYFASRPRANCLVCGGKYKMHKKCTCGLDKALAEYDIQRERIEAVVEVCKHHCGNLLCPDTGIKNALNNPNEPKGT